MSTTAMKFDPTRLWNKLENTPQPRWKTQQYIKDYRTSECLEFCSKMQRLLPRELRDMIYENLLPNPHGWHVMIDKNIATKINRRLRNPSFVGQQTHVELAQTWYLNSVFTTGNSSDMNYLLQCMYWGLPQMDFSQYIRHVHIEVKPIHAVRQDDWSNSSLYYRCKEGVCLPSNFAKLSSLRELATVAIRIRYEDWRYDGVANTSGRVSMDSWVTDVFPLLKQLADVGVKLAVIIDHREAVEVGPEHLDAKGWSNLVRGVRRCNYYS
ncbi:hypothetical protein G6011_04062 [Alternaria panax]|uniref:Uncharacterized protein n=1 Tax=Alternaria panax TaxID=48097 RepID=A0AAD4IGC2_9PLEO|nr:hypothetical protein G6011_04062 [Alternaria panax]